MSELRQKEMMSQLKNPTGYFKVFVQELKITSPQQFKLNQNIKIGVTLDRVKKQSKTFAIKNSVIEICQNFVFVGAADSQITFDMVSENQRNNLAYCSFPIQKMYSLERIKHNVRIDLIIEKKYDGSSLRVKVAELRVQLLHINIDIGILRLKVIRVTLKEELKQNSRPIIEINNQKYSLELSIRKCQKQLQKKIMEPEITSQIYFETIETQVSIKYCVDDYDSKNILKCQLNLDLIGDDYLCPFEDEWTRQIKLTRKNKKNQEVAIMLISTQFSINWEKQF